jgi:hypothetical protein
VADEVTCCEVCGEPVKPYVDARGSVLLHTANPEHWRLGYEREKARAEKAVARAEQYERDWYAAKNDFGTAMAKSREALAAARRECEGLRTALSKIRDECSFMFHRDIPWVRHVAAEALAAPADGEEGT